MLAINSPQLCKAFSIKESAAVKMPLVLGSIGEYDLYQLNNLNLRE